MPRLLPPLVVSLATFGLLPGCATSPGDLGGVDDDDGGEADSAAPSDDGNSSAADDGAGSDGGTTAGGDTGEPPLECDGVVDAATSVPHRLTRAQYQNTIADLVAITVDASAIPQTTVGAFASSDLIGGYELAATNLAGTVVAQADLTPLLDCDVMTGDRACAEAFATEFGGRAWRRPLRMSEFDALMAAFDADDGTFQTAIQAVMFEVLTAPEFWSLPEVGSPTADPNLALLTGHEVASRLSYSLWNSMPDDALLAAAQAGELDTVAGIEAQAGRMLADPRIETGWSTHYGQLMGLDGWAPGIDPATEASMRREIGEYVRRWLGGGATYPTLLTATGTMVDAELIGFYGSDLANPPAPSPAFVPAEFVPIRRQGLVMLSGVMTATSTPTSRGKLIRERLLCQVIPPPPPDIDADPIDIPPGQTRREVYEQANGAPSCIACHEMMDELGFAFENFGPDGRWRTTDQGQPVDTSVDLPNAGGAPNGTYAGPFELMQAISTNPLAMDCAADNWFRFALRRFETQRDACSLEAIRLAFADSGGDVEAALRAIVVSDSFRHVRTE